ncbi:MAG: glycosyltransferase family 39 protein [Candidatus Heimdallarchaeota archaeon]|nr:glycosyltransferase family 39 protein [Candidatus Heimdallarchaeota archaeon]
MIENNSLEKLIDNGFIQFNLKNKSSYVKKDRVIILLTFLMVIFGFIIRTWRMIREGSPITYDGYYYLINIKRDFFQGWLDLTSLTRDPPGFTFMIIIATYLLGLSIEPLSWAIYIFPQIVCTLQLVIFYILAKRLTKSKTIGVLSMFYMCLIGIYVYRNQNIAPETMVLGLVPYVIFYILRFYETKDYRYIILGLLITFVIAFTHHLTTFIVLLIWHIAIIYTTFYKNKIKDKKSIKDVIVNLLILVFIDSSVFFLWLIVLKGFPINFIGDTLKGLFTDDYFTLPNILLLLTVIFILSICISILFYDFQNKKVNNTITISIVICFIIAFVVAMFYGASSPAQTLLSGLAMGTHAFVLAPLGVLGLTKIAKKTTIDGKIMRAWLFSGISIICITAIFPLMSSFLARLVLYLIPVGVILSAIAIVYMVKKINLRKFKALALIGLTGSMALTLFYSHPKPENNWGSQEVFWPAEFDTIYFLIAYANPPNNTIWQKNYPIQIDCDFRISVLVRGIGGFDTTVNGLGSSWLVQFLIKNDSQINDYVVNSSIKSLNPNIDYVIINDVIFNSGFHSNWVSYGEDNDNWIVKFPDIRKLISLNSLINRIYDNDIVQVLRPI